MVGSYLGLSGGDQPVVVLIATFSPSAFLWCRVAHPPLSTTLVSSKMDRNKLHNVFCSVSII